MKQRYLWVIEGAPSRTGPWNVWYEPQWDRASARAIAHGLRRIKDWKVTRIVKYVSE